MSAVEKSERFGYDDGDPSAALKGYSACSNADEKTRCRCFLLARPGGAVRSDRNALQDLPEGTSPMSAQVVCSFMT